MNQTEYRIHVAIIEHLKTAFPNLQYTHAGKARDETHAHFLSKMGYQAGTGDILWFYDGKFGEMEVKSVTGTQSAEQRTRQYWLEKHGGHYTLVKSVQEAHDYFKALGFVPFSKAVKEPNLATDAEIKKLNHGFYMPVKID